MGGAAAAVPTRARALQAQKSQAEGGAAGRGREGGRRSNQADTATGTCFPRRDHHIHIVSSSPVAAFDREHTSGVRRRAWQGRADRHVAALRRQLGGNAVDADLEEEEEEEEEE